MLGSVFLKDFYSIYDLDNYRMGIAPVYDFDKAASNEVDDTDAEIGGDAEDSGSTAQFLHDNMRNGLIFAGIFLSFVVLACYICKRRRDE